MTSSNCAGPNAFLVGPYVFRTVLFLLMVFQGNSEQERNSDILIIYVTVLTV